MSGEKYVLLAERVRDILEHQSWPMLSETRVRDLKSTTVTSTCAEAVHEAVAVLGTQEAADAGEVPRVLVVRRYRRGEELFRQGEAGWTAFYILNLNDILLMQQMRLEATTKQNERIALQLEINRLKDELQRRASIPADDPSLRRHGAHGHARSGLRRQKRNAANAQLHESAHGGHQEPRAADHLRSGRRAANAELRGRPCAIV